MVFKALPKLQEGLVNVRDGCFDSAGLVRSSSLLQHYLPGPKLPVDRLHEELRSLGELLRILGQFLEGVHIVQVVLFRFNIGLGLTDESVVALGSEVVVPVIVGEDLVSFVAGVELEVGSLLIISLSILSWSLFLLRLGGALVLGSRPLILDCGRLEFSVDILSDDPTFRVGTQLVLFEGLVGLGRPGGIEPLGLLLLWGGLEPSLTGRHVRWSLLYAFASGWLVLVLVWSVDVLRLLRSKHPQTLVSRQSSRVVLVTARPSKREALDVGTPHLLLFHLVRVVGGGEVLVLEVALHLAEGSLLNTLTMKSLVVEEG